MALEIEIECECGAELKAYCVNYTIKIEPCPVCLSDTKEKGDADGYKRCEKERKESQ